MKPQGFWDKEAGTAARPPQRRRARHEEEIPLPQRQPQRERDTQPTEGERELTSARRGHCFRSYPSSVVSLQVGAYPAPVSSKTWARTNRGFSALSMTSTTIACFVSTSAEQMRGS